MTSRRSHLVAAVLVVLAVASGCSSGGSGGTSGASRARGRSLTGTHWVLSDPTNLGVPLNGVAVTAKLDAGVISGNSGCNGYRAPYTVDGSKLTISRPVAGTLMQCPPAPQAVETAYRARLPQVASYAIRGARLTFSGSDGAALLVYDAIDGSAALAGEWKATSYSTGEAVQSVASASTLTAKFEHGQVSGESGCNSFGGPYEVHGSSIDLGPLRSTLKACADPALQTQEQQYQEALHLASTYEVTNAILQLFRADGGITATFVR